MAEFYGVSGGGIADFHKIWIVDVATEVGVCGFLGEGTSKEIISNWDAPFADSSLAAKFAIVGGALQEAIDIRLQGAINSRQVWSGNQPYTFNLVMKFRAFTDPLKEVEYAIRALELMMAPDSASSMTMRVPGTVSIDFGRHQKFMDCCIKSMTVPYDKEKNSAGYLIRADVSLQVETRQTVTRTNILESYS